MKRQTYLILLAILFVIPIVTYAAGLVPCGGKTEPACEMCYFVTLLDNVMDWLVAVLTVLFTLMFVVSGLRLVISTGNAGEKEKAKKIIINGFIGYVIVLGAWLMVDFVLKALLDPVSDISVGFWHTIECTPQPQPVVSLDDALFQIDST